VFWGRVAPKSSSAGDAEELRRNLSVIELSGAWMFLASALKILSEDLGFARSVESGKAELGDGTPIPMLAYGAVEYLMGLDVSACDVCEFGGGNSTRFWSRRAASVTMLDNDRDWCRALERDALANVTVHHAEPGGLPDLFRGLARQFDIIVIDCRENRYECCRVARPALKNGGLMILDNSEWYPQSAAYLRGSGLIQVDFHDFRACHHHRTTTSLFFDRAFALKPEGPVQPKVPIGGKAVQGGNWDRPAQARER